VLVRSLVAVVTIVAALAVARAAHPIPSSPVVEMPAVEMSVVDAPAVEMPAVEMPAVELPAVEMPVVDAIDVEMPARAEPTLPSQRFAGSVDCTPIEAQGWKKGRKTPVTLVSIDGDRLERTTANAYLAMRDAAAKDGIELVIFSAFRSEAEQRYFYECFKTCACNSCAPAAKPGFSNHQMGRAIDIAMWPGVHDWLVAHAPGFGFAQTVRGEPWHWELRARAKPPASPMCPEPPKSTTKTKRRSATKPR
jgi:hypothetical protein